ncbi:monocarboxylate transporter 4-like [Montipora foliosa]|uniref:monocarboxylate transporter 4-like n=1 Tax=Montipora foliosa TaxID=591990 RepID=UPI0035F1D86B
MVGSCGKVASLKQDSIWSWFLCLCVTLCMILTIGFAFSFGVLFPVLMEDFGESREKTAWVSSTTMAVFMLLGPLMGAFINRFGCRVAIILGCLSCAAGLALGSFAQSILVLTIAFSVPFGVGVSFVYIAAPVTVTQNFTRRRSVALGIVTAGQGLGTMILGPTLQVLTDTFEWRNTFLIMAGVLVLASFTGCFHKGHTQPLKSSSSSTQDLKNSKRFSWNFSLWKNPRFLVMIVMAVIVNFYRVIPYVHLMKFCRDDLGMAADKSSTLFLFIGFFAATGRIGAGILCDLSCINSQFLYQAAVFLSGASIMLLVVAKTYPALAGVVVLFSLADGLTVSSFIIELFKSVKESQRASSLGFCMMAGVICTFSSPPLSGLMADRFGNYAPAFLMAGAVGVLASPVPFALSCMKRESSREQDEQVYLEELMDKDQTGFLQRKSKSDTTTTTTTTKSTSIFQLESSVCTTHKRPVSFIWAMGNPFDS